LPSDYSVLIFALTGVHYYPFAVGNEICRPIIKKKKQTTL